MSLKVYNTPEIAPAQVQSLLVEPLMQKSVFLAAGPRIFDTANELHLPKISPIASPGFTGEGEQIPEHDPDFSEVKLMPSGMDSVKVITRFSNELARQSVVSLDQAIKDRLVTDVAATLDKQFLGNGGDGRDTPRGLFAHTGIQTLDVDGALTLDHLLDAWGMLLTANVDMTRLRWFVDPGDFVSLRKIKDGSGRYMLQVDPTTDGVFRLWGAPVIVSSYVPEGSAALVDMSQIAVARDLAPSVTLLTETFADYDQQAIRVVARYDSAPLNPEAIVALTGIV